MEDNTSQPPRACRHRRSPPPLPWLLLVLQRLAGALGRRTAPRGGATILALLAAPTSADTPPAHYCTDRPPLDSPWCASCSALIDQWIVTQDTLAAPVPTRPADGAACATRAGLLDKGVA